MNSTFQRLYDSELLRTGSESRAYSRAVVLYGFLQFLACPPDGTGHLFPERTYKNHKAALRRAGLAPIETPYALAACGRDLGASSVESLARLVRHLNANVRWKPTTKRAAAERADLIAAAQSLISSGARSEEGDFGGESTEPAIANRVASGDVDDLSHPREGAR
jgi:hypothetical protein